VKLRLGLVLLLFPALALGQVTPGVDSAPATLFNKVVNFGATIINGSTLPGADMSLQVANAMIVLYSFSTTAGEIDYNGAGNQTWSVNPFAYAGANGGLPQTGSLNICGVANINVDVPIVKPDGGWRLEGNCHGGANGAGSFATHFIANTSGGFPSANPGGTITFGTAGYAGVVTGSGTTFTANMVGCALVGPSTQPTPANVTYGHIHSFTSTTSVTLGTEIVLGSGASSGSTYTMECPLLLLGDGYKTSGAGGPYMYTGENNHFTLDCNNDPICVGIQNWWSDEGTSVKDVNIFGIVDKGVDVETSYAQNSGPWDTIEVDFGASCTASSVSYVSRLGGNVQKGIWNSDLGSCPAHPGIDADIQSWGEPLVGLHVGSAVSAISLGDNTSCTVGCPYPPTAVDGVTLLSINAEGTGTNIVKLGSVSGGARGLTIHGITQNGGTGWTNAIDDVPNSCSDTDSRVGTYELNDGAGIIEDSTSSVAACQASPLLNNPHVAGGLVITGGSPEIYMPGGYIDGAGFGTPMQLPQYTVSGLPTCNGSTNNYTSVVVTDATAPTYLGTLTGGGSVKTRVLCNGTAWVAD
jgi:hypothetical protein